MALREDKTSDQMLKYVDNNMRIFYSFLGNKDVQGRWYALTYGNSYVVQFIGGFCCFVFICLFICLFFVGLFLCLIDCLFVGFLVTF